jgi:hypothetical protein
MRRGIDDLLREWRLATVGEELLDPVAEMIHRPLQISHAEINLQFPGFNLLLRRSDLRHRRLQLRDSLGILTQ